MEEFQKRDADQLRELIAAFETALQSGPESTIHAFLQHNDWILKHDTHQDGVVLAKPRLADKFIPDFLVLGHRRWSRDPRAYVTLVEIERASELLYTNSGDPTSFLTHAIQQVQDWKTWVADNRSYFTQNIARLSAEIAAGGGSDDRATQWAKYYRRDFDYGLTHGLVDHYLVIAGRRTAMTISQRIKLAALSDSLHDIHILTYDCIIEDIIRSYEERRLYPWRVRSLNYHG